MNFKKVNNNFGKTFYRFGILKIIITIFLVLNIVVNLNNANRILFLESGFFGAVSVILECFQVVLIIGAIFLLILNISKGYEKIIGYFLVAGIPLFLIFEKKGIEMIGEAVSLVENNNLAYTVKVLEPIFINIILAMIFIISSEWIFKGEREKEKLKKTQKDYDWFLKENIQSEEDRFDFEEIQKDVNNFFNKKINEKKIANLNKELEEWKKLLDSKQIDQITYEKESNRILNKIKKSEKIQNKSQKENVIFLCSFALLVVVVFLYNNFSVNKEIEKVASLRDIAEPIQINIDNQQGVIKRFDDTDVYIKFLANYTISGRVESTNHFLEDDLNHMINPVDLGITWGFLANKENVGKITFFHVDGYTLFCRINDRNFYNRYGMYQVNANSSNNHLTPCDEMVKKQLQAIKVGDYVKLEGYLMMSQYQVMTRNGLTPTYRGSSMNRYDTGDGACESIYVTSVKWLEEY